MRSPSPLKLLVKYVLIASLGIAGCTVTDIRRAGEIITSDDPGQAASRVAESKAREMAMNPQNIPAEARQLLARIEQFRHIIEAIWGKKEAREAGPKDYVKYTDKYYNRAHVDFQAGTVTVETVAPESQRAHLKRAIVTTLLTPDDPREVDLFSDTRPRPKAGSQPFLYKQVLDQDGKPVRWEWRAKRYADYLIAHRLDRVKIGDRAGLRVAFPLAAGAEEVRAYRYASLVRRYSRKYNVSESLVYGVIKTESSFNPFAVSPAPAYGLMQIVPSTAGRDVFHKIKRRHDEPTPDYLFNPENNIDTGTAYLHILQDDYLARIRDRNSRRYTVIAAYNGGTGNVLRTFSSDRGRAVRTINRMSPDEVFRRLTRSHPNPESRRYLVKVTQAQQEFWNKQ